MSKSRDEVISLLKAKGWTQEQAIGIAANLQAESAFNPAAVGDGGKAYGLAQWHPDRQANFKAQYGKPIQGSSIAEQVSFIDYELRQGNERGAGKRMLAATDPGQAADIFTRYYERPLAVDKDAAHRANIARGWAGLPQIPAAAAGAGSATGTPKVGAPTVGQRSLRPEGVTEEEWPTLPTARANRPVAAAEPDARPALIGAAVAQHGALSGTESGRAATDAAYDARVRQATVESETGLFDAYQARRVDPRDNPLFTVLDAVMADPDEPTPDGWTYAGVKDEVETGMSDDEREYLRENGRSGPQALERAKNQVAYRRDLDKTYANAGPFASVASSLMVGVTDPVGFALGLGTGKVLQLGKVGSRALANAGRTRAAAASFTAEAAISNMAWEGVQDYLGEVKTTGDYAMAGAMGAAMALPFVRGATRPDLPPVKPGAGPAAPPPTDVDNLGAAAMNQIDSVRTAVTRQQVDAGEVVHAENPNMTPTEVAREVERREANTIREAVAETKRRPSSLDGVVPQSLVQEQRDILEGKVDMDAEAPPPQPSTPPAPEAAPAATDKPPPKSPWIENPGGSKVRVGQHVKGSLALDASADVGAVLYEIRYPGGTILDMVLTKEGKLVPTEQAFTFDDKFGTGTISGRKSNGKAWVPSDQSVANKVRSLLEQRAATKNGSPERKAIDDAIAAIVKGDVGSTGAAPKATPGTPATPTAPAPTGKARTAPTPESAQAAKLPANLLGAKPRYGFGAKQFGLAFDSDFDRAAYILAQGKPSKRDKEYMEWAKKVSGLDDAAIRARGQEIRARLKEAAKEADPEDGPLRIEATEVPVREAESAPQPTTAPAPEATVGAPAASPAASQAFPDLFSAEAMDAGAPPKTSDFTTREVLQALVDDGRLSASDSKAVAYMLKAFPKKALDSIANFVEGARGLYNATEGRTTLPTKLGREGTAGEHAASMDTWSQSTAIHEAWHAATHDIIDAALKGGVDLSPSQMAAVRQLEALHAKYKERVQEVYFAEGVEPSHARYQAVYAGKNLHEFVSQVWSSPPVRELLRGMPGAEVAGKPSSAWQEMLSALARAMGFKKGDALHEATSLIDVMIAGGAPTSAGGVVLHAPLPPTVLTQFAHRFATGMVQHAKDFVSRNPIDTSRLKTLTQKMGGLSDGLRLAGSQNPIMQLVASLVTETTTGAAGRKANVAIRSDALHRSFVGNLLPDYEGHFGDWAAANKVSKHDKLITGESRRRFDKEVYLEMYQRRTDPAYSATPSPVTKAADALEATFERARLAQVESGTLGSDSLPSSARGYVPQALDGAKLQNLSTQDLHLFHQELSRQFQAEYGWDAAFADMFAPHYTTRVRKRAQGSKEMDASSAGGNSGQVVRDTLEELALDPSLRDRSAAAMSSVRPGHTKHRLGVDMTAELRPGLTMADLYVTDTMNLARQYSHRTAGYVALADAGILGPQGIRQLRDAAGTPVDGNPLPTKDEFAAFDRVFAEILGSPVEGRVVSAGATNLRLAVNLQKLGGLVWTQSAETLNLVMTLGLRSLVDGVPSLGRALGEVRRMVKGEKVDNPLLRSIELPGAEFGTEGYRMVAPLDAPNAQLGDYMNQPGLVSRLLRAGSHLQTAITGYRALMGAQHRMVAEQVVLKAMRFIRDGTESTALNDMGFTPEIVRAMRQDLDRVVQWDASGRVTSVDLTQVSDPRVAEAFIQAVHRGVGQIIQGTFVGERGAWAHNDYLNLVLQLRTFGLTAVEKQWGRQQMNYGYAAAAGMLLAQMALTLPIHLARVQANSVGREDREKFLEDNLNPAALIRATMNYSSMSGLLGDTLDIAGGVAAGWGGKEVGEMVGARQTTMSAGRIIPALGVIDSALKVASGKADTNTAIKQLPGSSIWYMVPLINLSKE